MSATTGALVEPSIEPSIEPCAAPVGAVALAPDADSLDAVQSAGDAAAWRGPAGRAAELEAVRATAQQRGLIRPGGARSIVHVGGILAAWAALVVVGEMADRWWAWAPIWTAIAFLIVGLAGVGHDCVHGTLVRSKRFNTVIGHAVLGAVAVPFATYRQFHLFHHVDTVGELDPEGAPAHFTSRAQYLLYHALLGPGFVATIWWATLRSAVGSPPAWARTAHSRRALRRAWLPVAPIAAALVIGSVTSELFRHAWLFPWLVVLVPVLPFVLLSEHYAGTPEVGILDNTYTIESNPITRFAIFNINFHTSHHLLPRAAGVHLRELDALVAPVASRRASGYLAFHRSVLRGLRWWAGTSNSPEVGPG